MNSFKTKITDYNRLYVGKIALDLTSGEIDLKYNGVIYKVKYSAETGCITSINDFHKQVESRINADIEVIQYAKNGVEVKFIEHSTQSFEEQKNEPFQTQHHFDDNKLKELLKEKRELLFSTLSQFAGNEYNVRTQLIDPILDCLGWTFPKHRHNEVVCHGINNSGCKADYALHNSNGYQIVIEAKSIDKNLFYEEKEDVQKYVNQLSTYLNKTNKFEKSIGILTNGYEWCLFDHKCKTIIFHTDIAKDNFIDFARLINFDDGKSYNDITTNAITYNLDNVFYPNGDAFRITNDKGELFNFKDGKLLDGTKSLHEFVKMLLDDNGKIQFEDGSFDKIIITTKGKDYFQRQLCEKHDYGNDTFITRDHDLNFKYLVIKQLIYQNEEYRGKWSVEYIKKDK